MIEGLRGLKESPQRVQLCMREPPNIECGDSEYVFIFGFGINRYQLGVYGFIIECWRGGG